MQSKGYILQENSLRVVIATMNSNNEKTGNMVQIWILNKNMNPVEAKAKGKDSVVCGSCPLKSGNGCYVNVGQAPLAVYKSYIKGIYSKNIEEFYLRLKGRAVRFGAYGDPSYMDIDIVKAIASKAYSFTGYTHQWVNRDFNIEFLDYFQASIDNENQLKLLEAKAPKAKYFRIVDNHADIKANEMICLNETKGISCEICGLCNGTTANIIVVKHGTQKNKVITK